MRNKSGVSVKYMCWCKKGSFGDFCDYTEEMRHCAEDVCNHHGIIDPINFVRFNKCVCQCEEFYSGDNCEIISPCRDMECINDGVCKLNSTGQPYCQCPNNLHLSSNETRVFGLFKLEEFINVCRGSLRND